MDDRAADVGAFSDRTLAEGYGAGADGDQAADRKKSSSSFTTTTNAANIVQQNIIKRFNQHSIMVMKATEKRKEGKDSMKEEEGEGAQAVVGGKRDKGAAADGARDKQGLPSLEKQKKTLLLLFKGLPALKSSM